MTVTILQICILILTFAVFAISLALFIAKMPKNGRNNRNEAFKYWGKRCIFLGLFLLLGSYGCALVEKIY